ncbi:MAG: hypothetical protein M3392_02220 [Actinomycetota bacterium]|nr:hypothetical protein [Actinomycetota bacterium]
MRGRAVLLITAMTAALMVASGVALAATIDCANVGNQCVGTNYNDTMTGTAGFDDMRGRGGGDTILAYGGADKLLGGKGNDPDVSAGPGNDSVEGQEGDDFLSGGNGNDIYVFRAGWGADRIPAGGEDAGMGTDTLEFRPSLVGELVDPFAEPLDVDLDPNTERDEVFTLFSDAGKQTLNFPDAVEIENVTGGKARDVIRGNNLSNSLSGNDGNDTLAGRDNDDALSGGLGADDLTGGMGIDKLDGGNGIDSDAYLFQNGWGDDEITHDAAGIDRLSFGQLDSPVTVDLAVSDTGVEVTSGVAPDPVNTVGWQSTGPSKIDIENVIGGTADDLLRGNDLANTLYGQSGADEMYGEGDADEMYGRVGNDTMFGGPGVDKVNGDHPDFPTETGDDTIDVADGNSIGDTVDCGPDATLSGDTVYVDAIRGPTGEITRIDTTTNCETVNEVLIN